LLTNYSKKVIFEYNSKAETITTINGKITLSILTN